MDRELSKNHGIPRAYIYKPFYKCTLSLKAFGEHLQTYDQENAATEFPDNFHDNKFTSSVCIAAVSATTACRFIS